MRGADLTTFMCRPSGNLGTSNSWKPLGLSRRVMGLLYLYVGTITPGLAIVIRNTCSCNGLKGLPFIQHFANHAVVSRISVRPNISLISENA